MSEQKMRDMFESGELTWADLLEITGLPAHVLYSILDDLIWKAQNVISQKIILFQKHPKRFSHEGLCWAH